MAIPQQCRQTVVWYAKTELQMSGCMEELHLMLDQLGSGSISCLRRQSKLNVWCGLTKVRIIDSFFLCEPTVTGPVFLCMLEQFVYPEVAAFQPSIIYQQDGAPHTEVWMFQGPSIQHFLIDGLDAMDRYVGHNVHRI